MPNGQKLEFYLVPVSNGAKKKFEFRIVGDSKLTKQLLSATKNHRVSERGIRECRSAIIALINEDKFTPLLKGEEITKYYRLFEEKFGESAKFNVEDHSEGPNPSFTAIITNAEFAGKNISGKSRTKACARVQAIKIALGEVDDDATSQHEATQADH